MFHTTIAMTAPISTDAMTNSEKQVSWPEQFSQRFHIFALGEQFDVDNFLATSPLAPTFVWKRLGNGPTNGLEIVLGEGAATPMCKQEEVATAFLLEHREALRELARFPGVEAVNLGLQYLLTIDATGCCLGPPAELMLAALNALVMPRYYVTVEARQISLSGEPT
jgi:hypothetical protein